MPKLHTTTMVTVSTPGKVHIMGEHAVVHGMPALLAAIHLRLSVTVRTADMLRINTESPVLREYMLYAVEQVRVSQKQDTIPPMELSVSSAIPFGYHLGSSAALAVATVGAVLYFIKQLWNPAVINQIAFDVEKKQHGNPSGGDNTICTLGGFVWYRKELDYLKSIWQLPLHMPAELNNFYLIDLGKPSETTGEMVALVQRRVEAFPVRMKTLFLQNEQATRNVAHALKSADEVRLMRAIQQGEKTLEGMGVVSRYAATVIRDIERCGGAAKILGGGGKKKQVGFLLGYHPDKAVLTACCKRHQVTMQPVALGGDGVRLETGKQYG